MSYLLSAVLVGMAVVGFLLAQKRWRAMREKARLREEAALAALAAGKLPPVEPEEESQTQIDAGLPTQLRGARGLEVGEEHVDIEALLASTPPGTAARARAQLEEPTNIEVVFDSNWASTGRQTGAPTTRSQSPSTVGNTANPAPKKLPLSLELEVPLRALVLAWYEARGYRPAPASGAIRPIDVVLRHRDDPARTYGFLYEAGRATGPRASAMLELARSAGLSRLLIVAEHGGDSSLRGNRVKGARLIDWPTIDGELRKLDQSVSSRIVEIARKRSRHGAALTAR